MHKAWKAWKSSKSGFLDFFWGREFFSTPSSAAAKVVAQLQDKFDYIIWRSLRHAPTLETILSQVVSFVSHQKCHQGELSQLIEYLCNSRCLIILDSVETILQTGCTNHYRPGYENYSQLFQLITETSRSSCVILTS